MLILSIFERRLFACESKLFKAFFSKPLLNFSILLLARSYIKLRFYYICYYSYIFIYIFKKHSLILSSSPQSCGFLGCELIESLNFIYNKKFYILLKILGASYVQHYCVQKFSHIYYITSIYSSRLLFFLDNYNCYSLLLDYSRVVKTFSSLPLLVNSKTSIFFYSYFFFFFLNSPRATL